MSDGTILGLILAVGFVLVQIDGVVLVDGLLDGSLLGDRLFFNVLAVDADGGLEGLKLIDGCKLGSLEPQLG